MFYEIRKWGDVTEREVWIMRSNHEVIVPNEDLPFKMFLFEGEHGNYFRERHWHQSIEIFAVFQGDLVFYLNDLELRLKSGDFILVNSNEIHAIYSPEPNQVVVIQIPLNALSHYFTADQYLCFTHEARETDTQVMGLIREMFTAYKKRGIGYDMLVKSRYYMLLYLLVSSYRELEVSDELLRQNRKLNKLTPITNYMKEHYQEELSLETLAEKFGYAPAYLSRMFQKYAGINYKDYLQSVRVKYALAELNRGECTVSEAALKHGFSDSRAFAKVFQKKYGMLPSEYLRKRLKDFPGMEKN